MTPGGVWDSEGMQIRSVVKREGEHLEEVPAAYTGTSSYHEADVPLSAPGTYEVLFYAHDPRNGNTGLDRVAFMAD